MSYFDNEPDEFIKRGGGNESDENDEFDEEDEYDEEDRDEIGEDDDIINSLRQTDERDDDNDPEQLNDNKYTKIGRAHV